MRMGWMIFLMMAFIILQIVVSMFSGTYLGGTAIDKLEALLQPDVMNFTNPISGAWTALNIGWGFLSIIWSIFWWDYPFFAGSWALARYIVFIPISIGLAFGLIMTLKGSNA
jgi:hypothetical protein